MSGYRDACARLTGKSRAGRERRSVMRRPLGVGLQTAIQHGVIIKRCWLMERTPAVPPAPPMSPVVDGAAARMLAKLRA